MKTFSTQTLAVLCVIGGCSSNPPAAVGDDTGDPTGSTTSAEATAAITDSTAGRATTSSTGDTGAPTTSTESTSVDPGSSSESSATTSATMTTGPCEPDCLARECGPDPVCGESCGTCELGECDVSGACVCTPNCDGRECGPDPVCGESCGTCEPGMCNATGQCECTPACGGIECGPDPVCGESCGSCTDPQSCQAGQCTPEVLFGACLHPNGFGPCPSDCYWIETDYALQYTAGEDACADSDGVWLDMQTCPAFGAFGTCTIDGGQPVPWDLLVHHVYYGAPPSCDGDTLEQGCQSSGGTFTPS